MDWIFLIIMFILCLVLVLCIGYNIYLQNKWYKRGYNETYEMFHRGQLGRVEKIDYVYHTSNENRYYHRGAYQAYKEINNLNN